MPHSERHLTSRMPPNILLVTTDSQRWDTLSCMGSGHAYSPNLDRLAAEGTLFTDAYTACPVCMPARCSLITGTHTQTHGAIENGIDPREHLVTFPTLLRNAGYHTMMIGKSHVSRLCPEYDAECIIEGEKRAASEDPYTRFLAERGHQRSAADLSSVPPDLHMESFLVDQTIGAIDNARSLSDRPFFAHCSLLSPHDPLDPPLPWLDLYRDKPLSDVNYRPGELDRHPALLHQTFGLRDRTHTNRFFQDADSLDHDEVARHRRRYLALAAFCDHQVGRLIDYLDRIELRENTLIIFTSDHGTQLFDHGFDDKHCYFDASWRVPMIFSMPGAVPTGEHRGMASWVDIAPSILAAAGLGCSSMQGLDLFTPLVNGTDNPRRCAVSTLYTSCAVVTDRWKLEWYAEESTGRLYDRRSDPGEQTSLFDSEEHVGIRDALLHAVLAWRSETIDVQWLRAQTRSGGPVARNVSGHTDQLRGDTPERRLNRTIAGMEPACVSHAHTGAT